MHDLATLVLHLHFFAGVAQELLAADLGDQVEGDLMGEHLGLIGLALGQRFHLVHQFNGAGSTGAGHSLVSRGGDGADGSDLIECVDGGDGDDSGAVGVGDDTLIPLHILGVHFGNHQGHIGIQAECGRIVHKDAAGLHNGGCELLSDIILGSAQDDVDTLKSLFAGQLDLHILALELQSLAGASGRGQGHQLPYGEIALFQ